MTLVDRDSGFGSGDRHMPPPGAVLYRLLSLVLTWRAGSPLEKCELASEPRPKGYPPQHSLFQQGMPAEPSWQPMEFWWHAGLALG